MLRCSPPSGEMLEQADRMRLDPAGTESNTATALARLGVRVAYVSALPDDPTGRWIAGRLQTHGVDVSHVIWTQDRAGVFFLETGTPPRGSRVEYDRARSAASRMYVDKMNWRVFDGARIVHTTGITAALSESCRSLVAMALREARSRGCLSSFDINYRAKLWTPDQAAATLTPLLGQVDLLVSTEADIRLLYGLKGTSQELIRQLVDRFGIDAMVLTLAEGGAAGWSSATGPVSVGAHRVEQVDRLGAGDAFDAGLLYGVLLGDLSFGMAAGAALAAVSYSEQGDMTWTTLEEALRLAGLSRKPSSWGRSS